MVAASTLGREHGPQHGGGQERCTRAHGAEDVPKQGGEREYVLMLLPWFSYRDPLYETNGSALMKTF